jgi:transposase-like protein
MPLVPRAADFSPPDGGRPVRPGGGGRHNRPEQVSEHQPGSVGRGDRPTATRKCWSGRSTHCYLEVLVGAIDPTATWKCWSGRSRPHSQRAVLVGAVPRYRHPEALVGTIPALRPAAWPKSAEVRIRLTPSAIHPRATASYPRAMTLASCDVAAVMIERIRDARFGDGATCLHCRADDVIRWGTQHGRQRYRCQVCRRTFSDTTRTPAAYTKRIHLWGRHLEHMARGTTTRQAAMDLGLCDATIRRWRRRTCRPLAAAERAVGGQRVEFCRSRGVLLGVDEQERAVATFLHVQASASCFDAFLRDYVLPGSSVIATDSAYSPFATAVRRAGMSYCANWNSQVVRPRKYAGRLFAWCLRFGGSRSWGALHFAWYEAVVRSGPDHFPSYCLATWAPSP